MKAEIERKKRLIQEKNVLAGPSKKYFKRGDLSAKQAEEYLQKYGPNQDEIRELENLKKEKTQKHVSSDDVDLLPILARAEVIRRLRERSQPIIIFAESEDEACRRLRKLEIEEGDMTIEGIRNDYKDALDKVDEVYLAEMLKSQGNEKETAEGGSSKRSRYDVEITETKVTYEDLEKMILDVDKGDPDYDCRVIAEYVKLMTSLWGYELNDRDEKLKMSVKGKLETGMYAQTRIYMKPLVRLLRKGTLPDDVRDSLVKLVGHALNRQYVKANEDYMALAIGNAPWPVGVTNSGIHKRPAHHAIMQKNVAHVLNDETQRKYIQGLKRLLTKTQQYYPTDPSRCIDFVKKQEVWTANEAPKSREISFISAKDEASCDGAD